MPSPGRDLSCLPVAFYPRTRRQSTMDTLSEEQLGAGSLWERRRSRSNARSKCTSDFLPKSSDKDYHSAPMTYFDEDADSGAEEASPNGNSGRPSPLRQFGTMVGSLLGIQQKNGGKRSAAGANRTQPLHLELAQKEQDELARKQDTIELLEWKVEQLQLVLSSPRAVQSTPSTLQESPRYTPSPLRSHDHHTGVTDFPELQATIPGKPQFQYSVSPLRFQKRQATVTEHGPEGCSKCHTDEEGAGKCRHEQFGNSPAHDPYVETKLLEKAVFESAILHLFAMTAVKARVAVRFFCKNFMKQMEVSGYSVLRTLGEVDRSIKFYKKEHAAFSLESWVNKALYRSFENDSFDEVGITRIINSEKRCMIRLRDYQRFKLIEEVDAVNPKHEDFDHHFWTFSENKLREIWFLFPWNLIFKDSHEKSTFNGAFLEAAKCVWQLHKLAFSVNPTVTILRVDKGMHANPKYVEQVTPIAQQCKKCEGPKIEFMTMPGFQTQKKVIKCQIYRHFQCV